MSAREGGPSGARPFRWAIAGCGWIARDHVAPALRAAGHELLAALDPDVGRARALRPRLATDDLDAALAAGADALYVATPNHLHRELTEAAAAAGLGVLCEKPMALTLADAEAMVGACRRAGVRYATAYNQRHHPAHAALREAVAAGRLGTLTQATVHYACTSPPWWGPDDWHFDAARAGGGAVADLAAHPLDLVGHLAGTTIAEVAAVRGTAHHEHPVEDGGALAVRYASGLTAAIAVSYACPETFPRRRLALVGTEAMALAEDTMGQTPGGRVTLLDGATGAARDLPFDRDGDPFRRQLEAFAAGAVPDPEEDLRTMWALERALRDEVAA